MKYFISLTVLLLVFINCTKSQTSFSDTVTIAAYNIDNYGINGGSSCPLEGSPVKNGYLRTVVNYIQPDIISFEKITATPVSFCTDTIKMSVLDSVCLGCYDTTKYTNVSGYSKVNTLFYKASKFGYISTTGIYTADNSISDINLHKLYYKSPSLSTTHDTIFLNIIVVHDASGSSSASTRATEIAGAMSWLSSNVTAPGNYIFMGDFNTQSSSEACFQDMINASDTMVRFYDPPNQLGDWNSDPSAFAMYLTQSTRTTDPGDCSSTASMTNRFDHMLCTNPIMHGYKNMQYLPNSFKVIGQDGLHVGEALTDAPTDVIVPSNVLNALYYMSEHLPVASKFVISKSYSLPVGFVYFNGSIINQTIHLQWQISNNTAATSYEIEKSLDGYTFNAIATVEANTNNSSSYSFVDNSPLENATYYRIKEMLTDGTYNYSNIVIIKNNNDIENIAIIPNPVKSNLLLSLESSQVDKATIHIYNSIGQLCLTNQANLQKGTNTISINNVSALPQGIYLLQIQTNNGTYCKNFFKL